MTSRRTPSVTAPAQLAALVLALALALTGCGDDEPSAQPDSGTTPSSSVTRNLTLPSGAATGKCMMPNVAALATQDTAFRGTVTAVDEGTATLDVERWFTGEPEADIVTVTSPSQELVELLSAVDFQVGSDYLVSSLAGQVSLCGFTAESTPELEAVYIEAFPG